MRLLILGATGTIGTQTINILKRKDDIKLVGISYFNNVDKAREITKDFNDIYVYSPNNDELNNVNNFDELIDKSKPDLILNSIIGFPGLKITMLCIKKNVNIALANKESIVMGGDILLNEARKNNVKIIPVDSEHTALYSLILNQTKKVEKLYITASGGKYYNSDKIDDFPFNEVVKHPVWNMGEKISVDSSTMINKFFEIVEAYYYFKIDNIEALYHPEVLIHALVKFSDGSITSNLYHPDMTWSIQQALYDFNSNDKLIKDMNIYNTYKIEKIDEEKWKPIKWANEFLRTKNNIIPIIVNIANDKLFELFKNGSIKFTQIIPIIEDSINNFINEKVNKIEDIYQLNDKISKYIIGLINAR